MQISRPYNNEIIVVEYFLSNSELNLLNTSFLANLDEEDWETDPGSDNRLVHIRNVIKNEYHAIPILAKRMTEKLHKLAITELGLKSRIEDIQPFNEIANLNSGIDEHDDSANAKSSVKWGAVVYLSREIVGGEIYYNKLDIAHAPKAGQLILHPGTEEYSHGVKPVTSGIRYSMPSFIFN